MYTKKLILSAASAEAYTDTPILDLNRKWIDQHRLMLKVDMTPEGGSSGILHIVCEIAESNASGTTFAPISHGGSGTSVILAGASITALPTLLIPITFAKSGVTDYMPPPPFIKFGYRAFQNPINFSLTLMGS